MKPSVVAAFPAFTEAIEGRINHMYLDVKGLVTIGAGVLLPDAESAAALRLYRPDGSEASNIMKRLHWETLAEQARVQRDRHARGAAWPANHFAPGALRLKEADLDALTLHRLDAFERSLKLASAHSAVFERAPADAQLAVMSMAWALGPAFMRGPNWPKFTAAFMRADWLGCAAECRMREAGNAGVKPRNDANVTLFEHAALTAKAHETVHGRWARDL